MIIWLEDPIPLKYVRILVARESSPTGMISTSLPNGGRLVGYEELSDSDSRTSRDGNTYFERRAFWVSCDDYWNCPRGLFCTGKPLSSSIWSDDLVKQGLYTPND